MGASIKIKAIILLAESGLLNQYIFGAYKDNGEATSFVKLPEDHQRFVEILTGQQTIMGRKTFDATPDDFPDAGRIVITHQPEEINSPGIGVKNLETALDLATKRAKKNGQKEIWIVGGASIIQQCIEENLLDEIKLTLTYAHIENVSNPVYLSFDLDNWEIKSDSGILIAENSEPKNLKYRYLDLI